MDAHRWQDGHRPGPSSTFASSSSSIHSSTNSTSNSPELSTTTLPLSNGFSESHSRRSSYDSFSAGGRDFSSHARRSSSFPWDPAIAEATHEQLMENRNLQYMKIHDSCTQLAERLERTQAAYNELGARFETLSTAYSKLVDAVSDKLQRPSITAPSSASSTDLVATMDTKDHLRLLKHADYNEVEYWTEEEYLKEVNRRKKDKGPATMVDTQTLRGGKRLADDENVMYWFVQRQDGSIVEGSVLKKARAHARKIFIYLHSCSLAPPCWNDASSLARSYYASEMRFLFPELRLCEHDYKSHRIATSIYPGWYSSYTNSNSKIEPEVLDNAAAAVIAGDSKRPASDPPNEEPAPKKLKQMSKPKVKSKSRSGASTGAPLPSVSALAPPPESLSHGTDLPPIPASFSSDVAAKPSTPDTVPSASSSAVSAALPPATAVPSTVTPWLPALPAAAPPPNAATPSPVTISTPAIPDLVSSIPSAAQPTVAATQVLPATGSTVNNPLAYLSEPAGPTTRAEFVEKTANKDAKKDAKVKEHTSSKSSEGGTESKPATKMTWLRATTSTTTRNICLKHYIKTVGKVTKAVFDKYYGDLSEEAHKNIIEGGTGDAGTGDAGPSQDKMS
ncbi:hypothetical protein B0H19DRAFT_1180537 [Mycena capillaripes]|nr:hypothetical protein B0H19DRAFT_1180537 [Mycena capillaripes]